jgi:MazG family protein
MERKTRALADLLEVVETLRAPGGCPWDREQTLADIGRYIVEEACEVADAVADARGRATAAVREEIGDVLMNLFLASRIAEEEGAFSLAEVAEATRDKLVRRHPHVFAGAKAGDAAEVLARWNAIKAEERRREREDRAEGGEPSGAHPSRLDGVPRSLPPLAAAYRITEKAARCGFDWPDPLSVVDKLEEETRELRALLAEGKGSAGVRVGEELGDILLTVVNLARKLGQPPDEALRASLKKFSERFREVERRLGDLGSRTLAEMDAVWERIKEEGR